MQHSGRSETQQVNPPNQQHGGVSGVGDATIGNGTKITLNVIWSLLAVLGPAITFFFLLYHAVTNVTGEVKSLDQKITGKLGRLEEQVAEVNGRIGDRWTKQMMVLFATELSLRNSTNLFVPRPEEIMQRMPPDRSYSRPFRDNSD